MVQDIKHEQFLGVLKSINCQFEIIAALLEANIRKTIDVEKATEIVIRKRKDKKKFIKAYNACNGKNSMTEIGKKFKIDQGNLSRAIDEWQQNGLLLKLENDGKVYPKALASL